MINLWFMKSKKTCFVACAFSFISDSFSSLKRFLDFLWSRAFQASCSLALLVVTVRNTWMWVFREKKVLSFPQVISDVKYGHNIYSFMEKYYDCISKITFTAACIRPWLNHDECASCWNKWSKADVFDVLQYKSVIVVLTVFTQPCSITNDLIHT